jgi:hypothetical protein
METPHFLAIPETILRSSSLNLMGIGLRGTDEFLVIGNSFFSAKRPDIFNSIGIVPASLLGRFYLLDVSFARKMYCISAS